MSKQGAKRIAALGILACLSVVATAQTEQVRYAVKDHGAPAYPNPIKFEQPDGKTVTLTLKGDGALHWAESTDGYKLVKDNRGYFCYGIKDAVKGMVASDVPALDVDARSASQRSFVSTLSRKIFFSKSLIVQRRASQKGFLKSSEAPSKAFPTSGKRKLLAILVGFSDVPMQRSKAEFNNLFNQKGYSVNGSTGSVADYFFDNSFGKMELTVDVAGPYTVSQAMSYYGGNDNEDSDLRPDQMVTEAIKLADKDVDFSQYDNDKDGKTDGIYVVFAGYGEEAGASSDAIWSHAWNIPAVICDGVKVSSYSTSPELKHNVAENPNALITPIGVICHEFSHVCGLPDYYDTDYEKSGGEASALGKFDVMSSGSWNNEGDTPPYTNSYSRTMLGWGTLKNFELKKTNTLLPHNGSNVGYKASTISNESFVFENRQKVKWDRFIPGHGMVVYHVVYDDNIWDSNEINNNPLKEYFQLVDAGSKQNASSSPFPGTTANKSFTFTTTPAFANWDGTDLKIPLLNITETGGNITVDAKTVQEVTFKVTDGLNPFSNATITIDGKTILTDLFGEATTEVSLLGSRKYAVSLPGYTTYMATFTTDENCKLEIVLQPDMSNMFMVTPNPVTSQPLTIVSKSPKATVYIYNTQGQLMLKKEIGIGSNKLDNVVLAKGVYIAKFSSPLKDESTKFIVL